MELSTDPLKSFEESEKIFLYSGLSIENLDYLIANVVAHSRLARKIRDMIARFLIAMVRLNADLGTSYFDNTLSDCAAMLLSPITNENSYIKVAIRKTIFKHLSNLKDVLSNVISPDSSTESMEVAEIQRILSPRCRLLGIDGCLSSDVSSKLAEIGIRTVIRTPNEMKFSLWGEVAENEFYEAFRKLEIASFIDSMVSYVRVDNFGNNEQERTVRTGDHADDKLSHLTMSGHGSKYGVMG
jgi:hypothetical protein